MRLDDADVATAILLVLTPDDNRPAILDNIEDSRLVWTSFVMIDQAIDEMLDDKNEVVSEREAFLLRELKKHAFRWPEFNEIHADVCQPNRPFQQVNRIGFYSKGVIYPLIPKIISVHDEVEIASGLYDGALSELVNQLVDLGKRPEGSVFKVLILSAPDAPDTLILANPIPNDKVSKSGKPTAFTMGHRYASSEALLRAATTSDLD